MLVTTLSALAVAGWLSWRAHRQPELLALAGFGAMMAFWCLGHWLILQDVYDIGVALVLANPLMPTFFLLFAAGFVNTGPGRDPFLSLLVRHRHRLIGLSLLVLLASVLGGAGTTQPWLDFPAFFVLTPVGWLNMVYTVALGFLAHAVLIWGFRKHTGNRRRSIVAMFLAGGLGLALATSFILPSLGLTVFPWPMLLLPSYVVLLVYGVVRYQMLDVNAWANRALLGLIMMLVLLGIMALVSAQAGQFGLAALGSVPGWQLWLYSALSLAVSAGVYAPLSRLVRRLVYPGSRLDEHRLKHWQQHLHEAASWEALADTARQLLSEALGQPVTVHLDDTNAPALESGRPLGPVLTASRQSGRWTCLPLEDADLAPGQRLTADVFASLLTAACNALENSLQRAQAERERLHEQHLVELGELSAAMAHELRNPLNIIAMAAASCDARTRTHIQAQISRADRLINDLLTYSGHLHIQPQRVTLKPLVQALSTGNLAESPRMTCAIPEDLQVWADPQRLQQVLINLLDNARSFARTRQDGQIHIEAAASGDGATWIRLHNNGPAIPLAQRPHLFQPFISKRPGGSGLGLAIVRRIMDAHGGQAAHRDDLGWPVTFEVRFPGAPSR